MSDNDTNATRRGSGSNDLLGHVRKALDGLAFAAFQAGANGEPVLGDCEDVSDWLGYVIREADKAVATERERCAAKVSMLYDEVSIAAGPHRSSYDEGRLDALDIAEQRLRA